MKFLIHQKNLLVIICMLFSFSVYSQGKTPMEGKWKMPDNVTEVEIKKKGNVFNGTAIKSDKENIVGKVILQDFRQEGNIWKGKFYAVNKNRLVNATLKKINDNTLDMQVKAGFMSKTVKLTRVE